LIKEKNNNTDNNTSQMKATFMEFIKNPRMLLICFFISAAW